MTGLLHAKAIILMQNHKAKLSIGFASWNYSQSTVTFQGCVPCSAFHRLTVLKRCFPWPLQFPLLPTLWYLDRKYRYLQQIWRKRKKKNQTPDYFLTSLKRKKENLKHKFLMLFTKNNNLLNSMCLLINYKATRCRSHFQCVVEGVYANEHKQKHF